MAIQNATAATRIPSVPTRRPAASVPAAFNGLGQDSLTLGARPSGIAQAVAPLAKAPLRGGNQVDLFVDGKQAYPQLHQLIDSAQERIDMEYFAFHNDPTANEIADKLIAKANAGVQVNVLVDGKANLHYGPIFDKLQAGGVNVRRFENGMGKLHWLQPFKDVTHRKILLVDGKAGTIGGMNIGDRYAKYWHDFMVKVQGPAIQDVYGEFEKNWNLSHGSPLRPVTLDTAPKGDQLAQVAVTTRNQHEIKQSLITAFDNAKDRILVNSPYFTDKDLVAHLKSAAERGVNVSLVVPTQGTNKMVDKLHVAVVNDLLASGAKAYHYDVSNPDFAQQSPYTDHFDHGKVAVVDGQWTSIGTANGDNLSTEINQEINLQIDSKDFASQVEGRIFQNDLAMGKSMAASATEMSLKDRVGQTFLKALRPRL